MKKECKNRGKGNCLCAKCKFYEGYNEKETNSFEKSTSQKEMNLLKLPNEIQCCGEVESRVIIRTRQSLNNRKNIKIRNSYRKKTAKIAPKYKRK